MKETEGPEVEYFDEKGIELRKRTYLPIVVRSKCPICGDACFSDLEGRYLSYPVVNGRVEIQFQCGKELDDGNPRHQHELAEWSVPYRLRVRLERDEEDGHSNP